MYKIKIMGSLAKPIVAKLLGHVNAARFSLAEASPA
jgi:hypothetical protein